MTKASPGDARNVSTFLPFYQLVFQNQTGYTICGCLMSGKGEKAASHCGSNLQSTVLHDSLGAYITVTCGSLSGNLD